MLESCVRSSPKNLAAPPPRPLGPVVVVWRGWLVAEAGADLRLLVG